MEGGGGRGARLWRRFFFLIFYCSFILCASQRVRSDEQLSAHDLPSAWQQVCSSLKKPLRQETRPPWPKLIDSWMIAGCWIWTEFLDFFLSVCRSHEESSIFLHLCALVSRNWFLGCYSVLHHLFLPVHTYFVNLFLLFSFSLCFLCTFFDSLVIPLLSRVCNRTNKLNHMKTHRTLADYS